MRTTIWSEKGMALMMSLGAIVIIGVLMGGIVCARRAPPRPPSWA